jgi:hypothetical protein
MDDKELKALLIACGWRHFYTYEDGLEEWTGPSDSDTPDMAAIRALVDATRAAEREQVRIPTCAEEAKAMAIVAIAWLREHAPEELRPEFRA